jgi:DNA anti-recombination protein RmuC
VEGPQAKNVSSVGGDRQWVHAEYRRAIWTELQLWIGVPLYDKFEGFVTDLIKIGKKMDEAKVEYSNAMTKLVEGKGNLVGSVERLKKMGAKAKKSLPESIVKRAEEEPNSN